MAVTLNITLTDSEQARLQEIANQIKPGITPAELKAWAEREAKRGLRSIVIQKLSDYNLNAMNVDWVQDLEEVPSQDPSLM